MAFACFAIHYLVKHNFIENSSFMTTSKFQALSKLLAALILFLFVQLQTRAQSNALNFDGVNDYVYTPTQVAAPGIFTMEAWFKTSASVGGPIVGFNDNTSNTGVVSHDRYIYTLNDGKITFGVHNGSVANYLTTTNSYNDGKYHHVAATYSGATGMNLYVDGVLVASNNVTGSVAYNGYWKIGGMANWGTNVYFNGTIDEVRIWSTARTATEIQNNLYNDVSPTATGLTNYFKFDQGLAGGTNTGIISLPNSTNTANNGVLSGFTLTAPATSNWVESYAMVVPVPTAATNNTATGFTANWTAPAIGTVTKYLLDVSTSPTFATFVTGYNALDCGTSLSQSVTGLTGNTFYYRVRADKTSVTGTGGTYGAPAMVILSSGNALSFDGVDDYVYTPTLVTNPTVFTLEAWFKTTTTTGGPIVGFNNATSNAGVTSYDRIVYMSSDGKLNFVVYSTANNILTSTIAYNDGKYHQVAASFSAATGMKLFVDGVLLTSNGLNSAVAYNGYWKIGGMINQSGTYFNGNIDEVRIWNTARTATEIQNNLYNGVSASSVGLTNYFKFDQGVAGGTNTGLISLPNSSNGTNNGVLSGFGLTGSTSNWVESYAMVVPVPTAATNYTETGFTANWTAPALGTVTGYLLDVSTSPTFATFVTGYNGMDCGTSLSQAVTGLSGTSYYYRVRANNTPVTGTGGFYGTPVTAVLSVGNALNFDGVNDYVYTSTQVAAPSTYTLEAWFKTSATIGGPIVGFNENTTNAATGNYDRFIYMLNDGKLTFGHFDGAGKYAASANSYNDGRYHHVAASYSSATGMNLYVDGVLVDTNNVTSSITYNGYWKIGGMNNWGTNVYFNGTIDEVRIWNTARTLTEIQNNMYNGVSAVAGLTNYFKFDQGTSGSANTGLISLSNSAFATNNGVLSGFGLTGATSNWVESYAMAVPVPAEATTISSTGFTANWTAPALGTVTKYLLDVSTSSTFATFVTGYNGLDCGTNLSQAVTGLSGTTFYYRVRADKTSVTGMGGIYRTAVTVALPPGITSATPASGPVGTLVTIVGTNLTASTAFTIGGVPALVISNTGTNLVALVMPGATSAGIAIGSVSGTGTAAFTVTPTLYPSVQQGSKMVGDGMTGNASLGYSVALSADGNTAIVGGLHDNTNQGAVWIYTRSAGVWSPQGSKLVGTGNTGMAIQGSSVAISADGNTAIVGGYSDNNYQGAAWIWTRTGTTWSQQGSKLVGTGNTGAAFQGFSVALSADGNIALIGAQSDNSNQGAVWVFSRSAGIWAQQGSKLVGTGNIGAALQGSSVALSADGFTAVVGGHWDNTKIGAVWVYTRTGSSWSQQGSKLVGTEGIGQSNQGQSVSVSADGNTVMSGGPEDNYSIGAAWVFTRSGSSWSQQGSKLLVTGNINQARQGNSVSLSADGNTAIVGGSSDNGGLGAAWVFARSGATWSQKGNKLVGAANIGNPYQSCSVALSADGTTAMSGGYTDNGFKGAAWAYTYAPPSVEVYNGIDFVASYSTLKTAFDAINAGTHTGDITVKIIASHVLTASAVLNASGTGSASYTNLLIYPDKTGLTISGYILGPLIDLNGADNVTIDGRINRTGTANDLIISNTSTAGNDGVSTIRFINDASSNRVQYCTLKNSAVGIGGTLFFSTGIITGNNNNIIDHNNITSAYNTGRPVVCVNSVGLSAAVLNSKNTISNNNFYDFLNPSNLSCAISIESFSTAWSITGNSFYETTAFAPVVGSNVVYMIIKVNTATGNNFTISDNFIGGSAPSCGGTPFTKTNTGNNAFWGIYISTAGGTASNIQGNTITNFSYANTRNAYWTGIGVANCAANINVGTTTGNTIGSATGTDAIVITAGGTGNGYNYGISNSNNSLTGTLDIQNNTIGAITTAHTNTNNSATFYGIQISNHYGTVTLKNNTIGSLSTANSINASSPALIYDQNVIGIFYYSTTGSLVASGNIIANLTNSTSNTNTLTGGIIRGMDINGGTITNNTVRDLTIANGNISNISPSATGIFLGSGYTLTVNGNNIYNLSNNNPSFAGTVTGLYYGNYSTASTVSGNFIHNLSVNASSNSGTINGLMITAGPATFFNNIISLGGNTATTIYGINENNQYNSANLYFNSVYIGGSPGSGALNSYAFYSALDNVRILKNNVFVNARSNNGATGTHYAINIINGSSLSSDYNNYYASGMGGKLGRYGSTDITSLPIAAGQDLNSLAIDPLFANAGGMLFTDYKPAAALSGTTIAGYPTDFAGTTRNTPPTMGVYESITATPPTIGPLTVSAKTYGNANFTLAAPTSNSTGAFTFTSSNTAVATISGNTVTITGAGTSSIVATQAATSSFSAGSVTELFTVGKADQILTLGALPTGGVALNTFTTLAVSATSSAGLTPVISLSAGSVATINESSGSYSLSAIGTTGTVTIKVDQTGNINYNAASITQSFDVTKGNQTITFDALSPLTYSAGLTDNLIATTTASGLTVSFAVISGPATLSGNTLTITGSGTVVVEASQAGTVNWNEATTVTRSLLVNEGSPSIISFTPTSATMGQAVTINGTNFKDITGVSFGATPATSFTVVDVNTITAIVGDGSTGTISVATLGGTATSPNSFTYLKPEITVFGATITNKTYDGTTDATITGAILYGITFGDDVSINTLTGTFNQSAIGNNIAVPATLTLKGADKDKYTIVQPTGLTGNILAKELTVTGASVTSRSYNGTTDATITGATLSGVLTGEIVTLANSTTGIFAQSDAGTGITVTIAMTLAGSAKGNYTLTQPTLTGDITGTILTVTGATAENKTYDTTTDAILSGAVLNGVLAGDDVTLDALTGTFDQASVGTAIPVTATLTIKGVDKIKYILTQPTGLTANITTATLSVIGASANNKAYDGTTDATISSDLLDGVIGSDNVSVASMTGTFSQSAIGVDLAVTPAITIFGTASGNYTLTQPTALKANITAKELTVTDALVTSKNYDGNTDAAITGAKLSGVVGAENVTLGNSTTGTFAQATVKTAISVTTVMTLGGTAKANYFLTQPTLTGDINLANPVITSFTPTSVGTGTTVTITGTDFTDASAVNFGGTAAGTFTVLSSTTITATVASGRTGSVRVTTPGGTATLEGFIYIGNFVWTGTADSDWNTQANWNPTSVPVATDNILIPNVINMPMATDVSIASGVAITIASQASLSITGTLTNNSVGGIVIQSDASGTGSLIVNAVAGPGTAIAQRYMSGTHWHLTSSPVSGQSVSNFLSANSAIATKGSDRGMMDYNELSNLWNAYYTTGAGNITIGKGYSMRTGTSAAVTFTGFLNASTYNVTTTKTANYGWNCIGNPYTSAIYINSAANPTHNFITDNSSNLDASYACIYMWDETASTTQYQIINQASDATTISIGQAFMIKTVADGNNITFTPAMQVHQVTLALKAGAAPWPEIKLKAVLDNKIVSTSVKFIEGMTQGLDVGYDAGIFNTDPSLAVYTRLVEDNGVDFALQCLPNSNFKGTIIPVGLNSKTGGNVIFSAETINLASDCKAILEDKLANTFTDLTQGTYKTTIASNSVLADRFRLHTSTSVSKTPRNPVTASGLNVYAVSNVEIHVVGQVSKDAIATLFDVQGKAVQIEKLLEGNLNVIPVAGFSTGMYLISVRDGARSQTFKIVLKQ